MRSRKIMNTLARPRSVDSKCSIFALGGFKNDVQEADWLLL